MEIFIPYTTLEQKQGIKTEYNSKFTLLREDVRSGLRFLVYDDGIAPPFDVSDEIVKAGFLVFLDYVNALLAGTYIAKTPKNLLTDVKAKMGQ